MKLLRTLLLVSAAPLAARPLPRQARRSQRRDHRGHTPPATIRGTRRLRQAAAALPQDPRVCLPARPAPRRSTPSPLTLPESSTTSRRWKAPASREYLGIEPTSFSLAYIDTKVGTGELAAPHK